AKINMLRHVRGRQHDRAPKTTPDSSCGERAVVTDLGDLPTCTVAHPCVLRAQSPVVTSSNDRVPNTCQRPVVEFHLTPRAQRTVKNQIGAGTAVGCGDGLCRAPGLMESFLLGIHRLIYELRSSWHRAEMV